jgi:hypothetical protein
MVFKHKHEDKIIKIMPRVPSQAPVRYIKRKLDDKDWMVQYGWTYLASDSTTKFWKRVMKYKTSSPKGWLQSVPNWMPKVSDADSARIGYDTMIDLIDQQLAKEMPICCGGSMEVDGGIYYCPVCEDSENWVESDELLNIFTTNQVREVQINYVIMEYLPEKADPITHDEQATWQREIHGWMWNNMATLVRDIVSNEDNYLRRATGELVFFDPVVTMMPSPKAFAEMNTMNSMNFVEMLCGMNHDEYIETYEEYYDDLKPLKVVGQYCVPRGPIESDSDYLSLGWYRAEEPSLDNHTLYEIANSNVIGNNWSTNVGRYA